MSETSRPSHPEITERAQGRCEYCHKPDDPAFNTYRHEFDHIIAEKHGGKTMAENLAYACFQCNRHKGTDLASIDPQTGRITRLFNPRTQGWDNHFRMNGDGTISPRTAAGRATARLLHFNDPARVQIRAELIAAGKLGVKRGQS